MNLEAWLPLLRCPRSGAAISLADEAVQPDGRIPSRNGRGDGGDASWAEGVQDGGDDRSAGLGQGEGTTSSGGTRRLISPVAAYAVSPDGIPIFCGADLSAHARIQQRHYDRIAAAYAANLAYPHTIGYGEHLDTAVHAAAERAGFDGSLVVEVCCGTGEAMGLLGRRVARGIGVDISLAMLERARARHPGADRLFVQGDATSLPLRDGVASAVVLLGGIHHVSARDRLYAEIRRILRPGGVLIFREPLDDLWAWRALRWIVYRASPLLDHRSEQPLRRRSTAAALSGAGLTLEAWRTYGSLGSCIFMNSDVLVLNRLFRFIPGIRTVAGWAARMDAAIISLPGLHGSGLQVVGVARRPC